MYDDVTDVGVNDNVDDGEDDDDDEEDGGGDDGMLITVVLMMVVMSIPIRVVNDDDYGNDRVGYAVVANGAPTYEGYDEDGHCICRC